MFDKFFSDIVAHPDNDAPRLVLADWLDDQGDPRGEFIRVQCELAGMDWDDPRFIDLTLRESELLTKHRAKWVKETEKVKGVAFGAYEPFDVPLGESRRVYFHRGMLEHAVFKDHKRFEENSDALIQNNLIRRISFNDFPQTKIVSFLLSPATSRLRSVDFSQARIGEHLDAFKESELATNAELLGFSECHLGDYGIEKFLTPENKKQEEAFRSIKDLDLSFNSLRSPDQVKAIFAWPRIGQLRRLSLGLNSLENSLSVVARGAKSLGNLFSLNLWGNDFKHAPADSFVDFCKVKHFKRLVHLKLSFCTLRHRNLEALAKMHLPALRELDLGTNDFQADELASLATAKWMSNLRRLDVGDNYIQDEGAALVATAPAFSQVSHLCLRDNNISNQGVRALIDSETLTQIRYLNIGGNNIDKDVLKQLKKRFPKAVVDKPYG